MNDWESDPLILLRWESESSTFQYEDPDGFIYETAGDIHVGDDVDELQLAGKFRIYYVDVDGAVDDGESMFEVLDAHSRAIVEYYDPLFSPESNSFNDRVLELVEHEVVGGNLLILDRLEVLPRYRGGGIGLEIMKHMIRRFSAGTGIIAIKPFPLQFEVSDSNGIEQGWRAELALEKLPRNEKAATGKLREYYGRVRFVPVPDSPIMIRATAWPLPSNVDA